ncbi:MAG: phenylalanine--tRNA ligase subunit alpha, partial [Weeksellaceae bacterium]
MIDEIKKYTDEVTNFSSTNLDEIESFRIKFLGKKGIQNDLFARFKSIPNEQKKDVGQALNQLKVAATEKVNELKAACNAEEYTHQNIDYTLPGNPIDLGSRHPISIVRNR